VRWTIRTDHGTRAQGRRFVAESQGARVRSDVLEALTPWP